jgi:hypothetical protein
MPTTTKKCLIVERHPWETGGNQRQIQFLLSSASTFFGTINSKRIIVNVYTNRRASTPQFVYRSEVSKIYNNGTRRLNRFSFMSRIPSSFVFFQETNIPNEYDLWWEVDRPIIVAHFRNENWQQGNNSQYGRGRLSVIVNGVIPKFIDRI